MKKVHKVFLSALIFGIFFGYFAYGEPNGVIHSLFSWVFTGYFFWKIFQKWSLENFLFGLASFLLGLPVLLYNNPASESVRFLIYTLPFVFLLLSERKILFSELFLWKQKKYRSGLFFTFTENYTLAPVEVGKAFLGIKFMKTKTYLEILKGLFIAFPVVMFLLAMLSSADPLFEQFIGDFFRLINFEGFLSFIGNGFWSAVFGYYSLGILIFAFIRDRKKIEKKENSEEKNILEKVKSHISSSIVLVSINLVYFVFLIFQFRYLFGGKGNINLDGYTYAEYARKGFFELIFIAILNLFVIKVFDLKSKNFSKKVALFFKSNLIFIIAFTFVILISSISKLVLYEQAYGLTQLRFFVHWAQITLILVFAILGTKLVLDFDYENLAKYIFFTVLFSFLSYSTLNSDKIIANWNIENWKSVEENDLRYFAKLSVDSKSIGTSILDKEEIDLDYDDRRYLGRAEEEIWKIKCEKLSERSILNWNWSYWKNC